MLCKLKECSVDSVNLQRAFSYLSGSWCSLEQAGLAGITPGLPWFASDPDAHT
jgi:hypothetical protein